MNEWQVAEYLSVVLTIGLICITLLSIIWQYVWAWVDDSDKPRNYIYMVK